MFVVMEESSLTRHYHPESIGYIRVHGIVHSKGFDECIVMWPWTSSMLLYYYYGKIHIKFAILTNHFKALFTLLYKHHYHSSPKLFLSCKTETLYPSNACPPSPSASGNPFCFLSLGFPHSISITEVESCSIWPFVTGFFHFQSLAACAPIPPLGSPASGRGSNSLLKRGMCPENKTLQVLLAIFL